MVGIAGGAEKCNYIVKELGFDAAIDYKSEDVRKSLRQHCPNGIDVYFDNVGGDILDAALAQLARGARVVICGAISQYCNTTPIKGPSNYLSLLVNRASMTGMVVFDYADRYPDTADGKSLQKAFLRSPLKFGAPVTSHFSKARFHPILKTYRPHLGTDYGAPVGTPVQTIGSGRVVFAGRKGGDGNMVHIVHSNGYETMYLHLSRMFVRSGERVEIRILIDSGS